MPTPQENLYSTDDIKTAIFYQLIEGLDGHEELARSNMALAENAVLKQSYEEAKDSIYDIVSPHLGECLWLLEQHEILSGNETKIPLPDSPTEMLSNDYSMWSLAVSLKKTVTSIANLSETKLKDLEDIAAQQKEKRDQKKLEVNTNALQTQNKSISIKRRQGPKT